MEKHGEKPWGAKEVSVAKWMFYDIMNFSCKFIYGIKF